ncbi:Protein of unknown function [Friedmanniella luteola]|uniref:DUF3500 domain-containing protein n=1 Tax=Friedmanniella luteola TaxID=546871 RepID=A0A1H1LA39_9ACTN|nr:DUF3500 domain-containing protein [Friedmanniella luteola]SDR71287.1 Protein of unknown function [Friedmanniella luteola]
MAAAVIAGCGSTSTTSSSPTTSTSATPSSSTTATADGVAAAGSVAALAQAFYQTLTDDQKPTVLLDYTLDSAKRWSNLPQGLLAGGMGGGAGAGGRPSGASGQPSGMPSGEPGGDGSGAPGGGAGGGSGSRVGIALADLNAEQLAAFTPLLKAATGTTAGLGYEEIEWQLAADDYLGANGGGDTYGRGQFYVALLGSPQDTGTWEFQFGGHHLAVANTYTDGKLAGATPAFRGVEPNTDFEQDGTSYPAPLKVKEAAFQALLASLSTDQQTSAKLSDTFTDLVLGPGQDWAFPTTKDGVQVSTLTADQKKLVLAAIATYVNDIADADAKTILARYQSELDDTYLAYSGTTALTEQNDYVRVDGPSVWIEFSMQHGIVLSGNHPHSVWRDRTTDYGGTKS